MLRFAKYCKKYKLHFFIGLLFKMTEAGFDLIIPLIMAKIIDEGIPSGNIGDVFLRGGQMVALGVIGLIIAVIAQYCAAKAALGFGTEVRNDLFRHMNTFSHKDIDELGTPSLITRITNDVNNLQVAVNVIIRIFTRAPVILIGSIIMSMTVNLKLSIIFLIVMPLILLTLYFVMSRSVPYFTVIQKKVDRISVITRENLEGVRVIRAFSRQKKEESRFQDASNELAQEAIRVGRISTLLNPSTYLITNLGVVVIIWLGSKYVFQGLVTSGEIVALINYMSQILIALVLLANVVIIINKAAASAIRVNEIFDRAPSIEEPAKDTLPQETKVTEKPIISFQDVSFSYSSGGENTLSHVQLDIYPGQTIGIIGGTGAGKSTLASLIPRFYDVTEGAVELNGKNVKEYTFRQLRQAIGMVPQTAVLFSGTLEDNLKWGNENATQEEMIQALKIAQAWDFVQKLPAGLQTPILQGGKNLSGGQRQRITIARALVKNPDILILDDSASALDFATDAALRKALRQETKGMTVLIISQRANAIKHADTILVLDDGNVAGVGTHEDLFAHCDTYREICLSQLSQEEVHK